ncbi:MAG: hypothetical protein ABMA25_01605 [Ilumatobacteraceae bacterium]
MTIQPAADRREAAQRLLTWGDTGVVENAAVLLILDRSVLSMSLVCEALATQDAAQDYEGQETILWVLAPAWESGEVDVPSLLREIRVTGNEGARLGAAIAIEWLQIDA